MKLKALFILLGIILTSFYYFPFSYVFFPVTNSKMMLAAIGLLILLIKLGENGHQEINKDFFMVSLYALGISFACLLTIVVNNSTDSAYLSYIVSMWVWTGAAYFIVNYINAIHRRINVDLVCFYLIAVGVFQCLLAVLMGMYSPLQEFIDGYFGGGFIEKYKERLHGIGCAFDTAGSRFAVLLTMIAFLLPRMFERKAPRTHIIFLLSSFCFIAVVGNMIGRTTTIGLIMAICYWICYLLFHKTDYQHAKKKLCLWIGGFVFAMVFISIFLYNFNEQWHDYFRFGFEGFFSLVEKGRWEVSSNELLKQGMVFPDNFWTWIIGDGYIGGMAWDPYYQGPLWYGYYKGTDAGYSRFLFYFGLIGLIFFILFMTKVCRVCIKRFPSYQYMFVMILLLNCFIWVKVSTDIFLAFAPFLCISKEENNASLETYNDSVKYYE